MVNQQRRRLLLGSLAISAGLICSPYELWAQTAKVPIASDFLNTLADLVIPATATVGAIEVGVPRFVLSALAHGLQGATDGMIERLHLAIDEYSGSDFLTLAPQQQHRKLAEIDARVFANDPTLAVVLAEWRRLKALIVIGYYSSEVGSTQELRYQLIPGRFEPDVKLEGDRRGWSSDWTGVKYA